jgi:hypothetical protein
VKKVSIAHLSPKTVFSWFIFIFFSNKKLKSVGQKIAPYLKELQSSFLIKRTSFSLYESAEGEGD